jgi:chromosome segregation and condensation protein ScpB
VTEAFLRTEENPLTLNDLRQLAEVLTQLKNELDKQEKAYHEEGYT